MILGTKSEPEMRQRDQFKPDTAYIVHTWTARWIRKNRTKRGSVDDMNIRRWTKSNSLNHITNEPAWLWGPGSDQKCDRRLNRETSGENQFTPTKTNRMAKYRNRCWTITNHSHRLYYFQTCYKVTITGLYTQLFTGRPYQILKGQEDVHRIVELWNLLATPKSSYNPSI